MRRPRDEGEAPALSLEQFGRRFAEVQEMLRRHREFGRLERDQLIADVLQAVAEGQAEDPREIARLSRQLYEGEVWFA